MKIVTCKIVINEFIYAFILFLFRDFDQNWKCQPQQHRDNTIQTILLFLLFIVLFTTSLLMMFRKIQGLVKNAG